MESHRRLLDVLADAPADLDCWHFFAAPSALEFWSRRQAHETTVHRVDAELALGVEPSPVAADFAADGVEELLAGFHSRERSRVRTAYPRTLRMRAQDVPGAQWLVHLSDAPPRTERDDAGERPADCTVAAPAGQLYLALWNRASYEELAVEGDGSLIDLWRRTSAIG
ncbi:maleylpyruvate isomerase family mycothiol-dependent enzyme [Actinacidiphila yeochonensis]|uniref:maleylpyruvate isomerase family mycothiol-dependent enzyme n=1 Tax=Actinacidiphila yeochonensis TaxID=89050 RepID=UPI003898DA01